MAQEFNLIFILIWIPQAIDQIMAWIYWWQDKEYRIDRFILFIKTIDGRKELRIIPIFVKLLLIFLSFNHPMFLALLIATFLYLDSQTLLSIIKHKIRKPIMTERAIRMLMVVLTISGLMIFFGLWLKSNILLIILIEELMIIFLIYLGSFVTNIKTKNILRSEKLEVQKLIKNVKPFVIGVTGSYGKTTTKDFIFSLLNNKQNTVKNDGSQNTMFGIVRCMLPNLNKNTKYVVSEIGAYRKGEITKICNLINPQMGIITGIEPQHLGLFKSIENIIDAKYELIDSLPKNGTAIFNLNNEYCKAMYEKAKILGELKVYGYRVGFEKNNNENVLNSEIIDQINGKIKFKINYKGEENLFVAPFNTPFLIENLSAAILVAKILGVDWKVIKKSIDFLELPKKTMNIINLKNGSIVIDDSFNSTPIGFKSAISYLKSFDKKKIIFTTGIIELGNISYQVHKEIGKLLRSDFEKIILRNKEFEKSIREGLGNERYKLRTITNIDLLVKEFEKYISVSDYVVLLEGKLPNKIFDVLERHKI